MDVFTAVPAGARKPLADIENALAGLLVAFALSLVLTLAWPGSGWAHEAWLLSPEHMAERNAQPRPELFTHLTLANAAMLAAAALAVVGWVWLGTAGPARRLLAWDRLRVHERAAGLFLRTCLSLTLVMASLGLHPRHGTELLEAPTLAFPDLELRLLGGSWDWLAAVEVALATALWFASPALAAVGVLLLTALGLQLFGAAMLAYAGALAGAACYLVLRAKVDRPDEAPRAHERGLFLIRVLTGATFFWCGLYYKVLQPNLVLAIIVEGGVPTFGLGPEAFVFGMALVEVSAGALMIAGLLVRPLALALFVPFLFLSAALGENPLGHVLFYGNLAVLATGGAGSWRGAARRGALPRVAVQMASR